MPEEKRLNVRIPDDLYLEFKAICARRGLLMSDVIRDMITAWVTERKAE